MPGPTPISITVPLSCRVISVSRKLLLVRRQSLSVHIPLLIRQSRILVHTNPRITMPLPLTSHPPTHQSLTLRSPPHVPLNFSLSAPQHHPRGVPIILAIFIAIRTATRWSSLKLRLAPDEGAVRTELVDRSGGEAHCGVAAGCDCQPAVTAGCGFVGCGPAHLGLGERCGCCGCLEVPSSRLVGISANRTEPSSL